MYSYEERLKAVQLYIQYDKSYASVFREHGYCGKSGVESKMGNSPDSTKGGLNYDQTD
jgi:hypothetical protein